MTANQYRAAIARLGLSQVQAGKLLGVMPRQSRRWIAGDAAIPESAAKLLRLMVAGKLTIEDVERA